jgi:stage IV sporulation protein FB
MGLQDRPYYSDVESSGQKPLMRILNGSVPLFSAFGIRVRAHASLIIIILLVLLFGLGRGSTVEMRVQSMVILFAIILLHEFGHCFAARWTGGEANEIMLSPLGGLAMTMSRHNWWSRFATVAAGPLVNVILCFICGMSVFILSGNVLLTPWSIAEYVPKQGWFHVYNYLYWIFVVSYILLLFNLLPVFPLDGGQLLQAILWKYFGHYKSMLWTLNIGLPGAVLMGMVGLATLGTAGGGVLLILIAIFCFTNCLSTRRMLLAAGPYGMEEESVDYSAAYEPYSRPNRESRRAAKRSTKLARQERKDRERIDRILAKVSTHGMQSLNWWQRRKLKQATERQRQRDIEMRRRNRP